MEGAYKNVQTVYEELSDCRMHRQPALRALLPSAGLAAELDRVSFRYDERVPILTDVTLRLRTGEVVALRGVSGSGKSCLLNLIAGITEASTGTVRVDRSKVAYVPQEIALLDDTIRKNLLFGMAEENDAVLMRALDAASLEEFAAVQPLGLETRIGDNGVLLSGGQRQRLGVARALLRDVTLLLLDEATSALDEENERCILEKLTSSGIAILLVTHRRQAVEFAQRVYRLEEGRLIPESEADCGIANERAPVAAMG
jgi:ABC-type bacteriocin/lantibiotic exporter with double-glycine peptidase domain